MSARGFRSGLLLAVGAGLALRLVYALAIVGHGPLLGDALEFHLQANLLADGHGYVEPFVYRSTGRLLATADKPPLYPFLEAAVSLLGGRSWQWHHLVGCLAGAGTIGVVGLIGRRLAGPRVGLLAAGLAGAYPLLIATDGSLRSESVYALCVAIVLLCALRLRERPTGGRAAVLGAAIAAAALTRGEALLLLALVAVPVAVLGRPRAAGWRTAAIAAVACGVVLAPWLARCWTAFGQPVLISTNVGGLLAGANCAPTYDASSALFGQWDLGCIPGAQETNEAREAARLRRQGIEYARDHAGRLPAVLAARLGRSFELYRPREQARQEAFFEGRDLRVEQAGVAMYYALAAFALVGLVSLRRRGEPWALLLAPFALVVFVTLISYGFTRFRVAAEPALVVLAATGLAAVAERSRSRGRPSRRLAAAEG